MIVMMIIFIIIGMTYDSYAKVVDEIFDRPCQLKTLKFKCIKLNTQPQELRSVMLSCRFLMLLNSHLLVWSV